MEKGVVGIVGLAANGCAASNDVLSALELVDRDVLSCVALTIQRKLDAIGAYHSLQVAALTASHPEQREVRTPLAFVDGPPDQRKEACCPIKEQQANDLTATFGGRRLLQVTPQANSEACICDYLADTRDGGAARKAPAILPCPPSRRRASLHAARECRPLTCDGETRVTWSRFTATDVRRLPPVDAVLLREPSPFPIVL